MDRRGSIIDNDTESIKRILREISEQGVKRQWEITTEYWHYTSLPKLFSILENDELWAGNVRFSNDETEERLLDDGIYDDYMLCFCSEGDQLSQWRGYCHDGGASVRFKLSPLEEYSIVPINNANKSKRLLYKSGPIPVIYVDSNNEESGERREIEKWMKSRREDSQKIRPYLKNALFYEERESRLVFINREETLSKYIGFRDAGKGVRVPYMIVKYGDCDKMKKRCRTCACRYDEGCLQRIFDDASAIWIDEGRDQEDVFHDVDRRVKDFLRKNVFKENIPIYCKGHWPISEIIVAPTDDRERIAEQIQRFCKSKYWLRNVEVTASKIPFVH